MYASVLETLPLMNLIYICHCFYSSFKIVPSKWEMALGRGYVEIKIIQSEALQLVLDVLKLPI